MTVEGRALLRAVELAGSRKNLAERIGAKVEDVEKWLAGTGRPPRETFLRVVDVILDELAAPTASCDAPVDANN